MARYAAFVLLWLGGARAQNERMPAMAPEELVRQTVAQEVAASNRPVKHRFRSRKVTSNGSQTHLYVETTEAMAGMLIAVNDKPVTTEQEQAEWGHLDWLMNNPDQLHKKHVREQQDAERSLKIVKALPDAFQYEYAGTEPGTPQIGKPGDTLVRLKFSPKPNYSPPSHEDMVLAGMRGVLLIDADAKRLAEIDGTMFRDVTFGWGILGRLNQGGHFLVKQADVGDGTWDITEMNLNLTGKILMVKGFSMISDETFSDFQMVPASTTFAQGVAMLKAEREKAATSSPVETKP